MVFLVYLVGLVYSVCLVCWVGLVGLACWNNLSCKAKLFEDGHKEIIEVLDIFPGYFKYSLHVNFPVLMDNETSETYCFDHLFCEHTTQDAVFFEQIEYFTYTPGQAQSLIADNMRSNVDAILDGHLDIKQYALLAINIFQELRHINTALFNDSIQMLLDQTGFGQYEISINHLATLSSVSLSAPTAFDFDNSQILQ